MRAVIQRVQTASVSVEDRYENKINNGYMILLGVGINDSKDQAEKLWRKIFNLRLFRDDHGKTNLNLSSVNGSVLIVSQFTLFANCKRGNRPSFTESADPAKGNELYEYFVSLAKQEVPVVETGEFGASMQVSLVNDGPFTIVLDTDYL